MEVLANQYGVNMNFDQLVQSIQQLDSTLRDSTVQIQPTLSVKMLTTIQQTLSVESTDVSRSLNGQVESIEHQRKEGL